MRTARQMAKMVMKIAREEFGLQRENQGDLLSGPRMGDAFKLECALRLVMLEAEHRFRAKHPQLMEVKNTNFNNGLQKNIHEWVGPKPTQEETGEPKDLPNDIP